MSAPYSGQSRRYYDQADRPRRVRMQILSVLTIVFGLLYLGWAVYYHSPEHRGMAVFYILSEALCLWLFIMSVFGVWRLRFKPPEGIRPDRPWSVDVIVTTCNEPFNVVATTMRAVSRIQWAGPLAVYVLDDGPSDAVQALAAKLGFTYLSRPRSGVPRENAKGGNLNFGYRQGKGELVLVLDADQAPVPDVIGKMAGYMKFDRVAFVQSKQEYFVQERDPFYNSSAVFYDAVELGMDNCDCAISAGTGVLYRREALDDIGGFATWNIVEDLTSSYEFHSRGWRSFYFPHAVSRGLSPTDIWRVYQQRGQWAFDTMRIFFWDNPLFKRGLSARARLQYATVAESYIFSAIMLPFFYLIPVWTYLTGEALFLSRFGQFLVLRAAYLAVMVLAVHYMCKGRGAARQFQHLAGLFPVYLKGIVRAALYPRRRAKPAYRVNNARTGRPKRDWPPVIAVLPQLAFIAVNLAAPFYALAAGTCPVRLVAGNALLSAFTVWSLSSIVWAALSPKRWPEREDPDAFYALEPDDLPLIDKS